MSRIQKSHHLGWLFWITPSRFWEWVRETACKQHYETAFLTVIEFDSVMLGMINSCVYQDPASIFLQNMLAMRTAIWARTFGANILISRHKQTPSR